MILRDRLSADFVEDNYRLVPAPARIFLGNYFHQVLTGNSGRCNGVEEFFTTLFEELGKIGH